MDVFETGFPVQDDRRFSPIIVLLPPWVWEWHVIRPPIHNLLRCVLPGLAHSMLLPYQFVSLPLVQNLPGTPVSRLGMPTFPWMESTSRRVKVVRLYKEVDGRSGLLCKGNSRDIHKENCDLE